MNLGAGDDSFVFISGSSVDGMVDGADGEDTLTFTSLEGAPVQSVDGSAFINFETIDQSAGGSFDIFFSGEVGVDVVDRQLNGGDLFCLFVWDFSLEFFLERHD